MQGVCSCAACMHVEPRSGCRLPGCGAVRSQHWRRCLRHAGARCSVDRMLCMCARLSAVQEHLLGVCGCLSVLGGCACVLDVDRCDMQWP